MKFSGQTFIHDYDFKRLSSQFERGKYVMLKGGWWTLGELKEVVGGSEASLSARLRDFRKPEFGSYIVERRRRGDPNQGLHEYKLFKPDVRQKNMF